MIAIKLVGRGGQGAVLASQILSAAFFGEGLWVQSFPSFGAERRGAPVAAFLRVSEEPIYQRCAVRHPDWVILFDPTLRGLPATRAGTTEGTRLVANWPPTAGQPAGEDWGQRFHVDATAIAQELGLQTASFSLVNTAMVGAFAGASRLVGLESVAAAIRKLVPQKAEANETAARQAFAHIREDCP